MRAFTRTAATIAAAAVVVSGCQSPQQKDSPTAPPDLRGRTHFSIVWSDPAGLDLMSAEGTYVRASVESLSLAAVNGDRDAAYPGFWRSLAEPAAKYAEGYYGLGPDDSLFGISRFEVVDVARDAHRSTVGVCSYERQLGVENLDPQTVRPDGRYRFDRQGSYYWTLVVARTGPVAPPAGQRGRDAHPRAVMFGTWRTAEWRRPHHDGANPCRGRLTPGVGPDSWPALMPGSEPYVADAAPTAPSYPGWSNDAL
ncbi:hypothetical protein O6P37_15125 [Mycobacterium sp. CPCC 205372]|uniref:Lipoprotein n=1 Tax=Mycobacterium hippophais TaxID=3016340 RepID=A0ABT4PUF9_9MYCO|nr:hypothetical protein [Mycobacterium hippophais]MCZ8380202.1 hypothetical protein [Mycobacterium hippophais]